MTVVACAAERDPRVKSIQPPEALRISARDGETLHGALFHARHGDGPRPLVVHVYGGPHAQLVHDSWGQSIDMRAQWLTGRGFHVLRLDNRGSANRGYDFESAIRHETGRREVEDQVDGVRWLAARGDIDPSRVGIMGWSYGGYMACMALLRAPNVFKVGISGAPVSHWDGYDTHYTERYMGLPERNKEGYAASALMAHVSKLEGHLLLIHGLIDENVHFRHTARLLNALIEARKPYDLMLFPDERHMPRSERGRLYMEERITAYLERHLEP